MSDLGYFQIIDAMAIAPGSILIYIDAYEIADCGWGIICGNKNYYRYYYEHNFLQTHLVVIKKSLTYIGSRNYPYKLLPLNNRKAPYAIFFHKRSRLEY